MWAVGNDGQNSGGRQEGDVRQDSLWAQMPAFNEWREQLLIAEVWVQERTLAALERERIGKNIQPLYGLMSLTSHPSCPVDAEKRDLGGVTASGSTLKFMVITFCSSSLLA